MNNFIAKFMNWILHLYIPISTVITGIIFIFFHTKCINKIFNNDFLFNMIGTSSALISIILTVIPLVFLLNDRKGNKYIGNLLKNPNFNKIYDIYINIVINFSLILLFSLLFYFIEFNQFFKICLSFIYIYILISIILNFSVALFLFKKTIQIITNVSTDN